MIPSHEKEIIICCMCYGYEDFQRPGEIKIKIFTIYFQNMDEPIIDLGVIFRGFT
jgi:hypothetical protein